jgi:hypothetical protein
LSYGPRAKVQAEDPCIASIQKMAEYHHHFTNGLMADKLHSDLSAVGFREIGIHFHYSTLSLAQSQKHPVCFLYACQKLAFPFMAIVAKK